MQRSKKARFYVLIGPCQRIVLVAAIACAAIGAAADGPAATVSPAYRLNVANADSFRLAQGDGYAPASAPGNVKKLEIPVKLAAMPFAAEIHSAAQQAALDPALVHALIHVESRHNPAARSTKGAIGLMQLMPETAVRYGVNRAAHTPKANLKAGTSYLSELMTMFDNRLDLALAAYNAGENAVLRHGKRIPPYRETREYVPAVLAKYRELQEAAPSPQSAAVSVTYLPGTRLDPASLRAAK